jgi:hypothetical protein
VRPTGRGPRAVRYDRTRCHDCGVTNCSLRINTPDRPDEWEHQRVAFFERLPRAGQILTLQDGRQIEVIGAGTIDLQDVVWATELAPAKAA